MIANSTKYKPSKYNKELQKITPRKLSILIEEAKKIQHERVSNLKLQSIQSSPTSEINNNFESLFSNYAMFVKSKRKTEEVNEVKKNGSEKKENEKEKNKKRRKKKNKKILG